MKELAALAGQWRDFMEQAARGALHVIQHMQPARKTRVMETQPGVFCLEDGNVVDLRALHGAAGLLQDAELDVILHSAHVLIRKIQLPAQARAFVENIVAGQIDRLMPWPAGASHHGCRISSDSPEGVEVTIAAMSAAEMDRAVEAFNAHAPRRLRLLAQDENGAPIVLHDTAISSQAAAPLRKGMQMILIATSTVSVGACLLLLTTIDAAQFDLQRLSDRQAGLRTMIEGRGTSADASIRLRKADDRSVTLVLESLADLVPDDTSFINVDITGTRLVATGQSRDANALIGILERSGRFSEARFLAPTVRDSLGLERFQIESKIAARRIAE